MQMLFAVECEHILFFKITNLFAHCGEQIKFQTVTRTIFSFYLNQKFFRKLLRIFQKKSFDFVVRLDASIHV